VKNASVNAVSTIAKQGSDTFEVGAMRPDEVAAVAQMHYDFFGVGEMHGHSIANFGPGFLERVFYRLNLDNPYWFVDVARFNGKIIAFSAYTSERNKVFRYTLRKHFMRIGWHMFGNFVRHPIKVITHVIGNLAFLTDGVPDELKQIQGLWLLLAVYPEYRSREFKERTNIFVADAMWDQMENTLRAHNCAEICSSPGRHNAPINGLFAKHNAELVTCVPVQGIPSNYYRKRLI
jgi:hypothetical protein